MVHDWFDHAEDSVHMKLARQTLFFANGAMPKLTRLASDEKKSISEKYTRLAQENARREHESTPPSPTQTQPSHAMPDPDHAKPGARMPSGSGSDQNGGGGGVGSVGNLGPIMNRELLRISTNGKVRVALQDIGVENDSTIRSIAGKRGLTAEHVQQVAQDVREDPTVKDDIGAIVHRLRNGQAGAGGRWTVPRKRRA